MKKDEKKLLGEYTEYIFGDDIVVKSTSNSNVKVIYGNNGTMKVATGDILVFADKGQLYKAVADFNWDWDGARPAEEVPDQITLQNVCFVAKLKN